MAYQQVALELARDGQCTPWGFRLTGGADIGTPLVVQRVTFGSPSEGELQKGDLLLRIRDTDATRLSHQTATELISRTGTVLNLVVARSANPAAISGLSTPPQNSVFSPTPSEGASPFLFKPLPTTQFGAQRQRRFSNESYTSTASSDFEKDAITSQPYRSTPLILPGAKASKDIPVGSYLRFDPLTKRTSSPTHAGFRSADPSYMLNKVQEAIIEAAQCSSNISSPGRTPTPDLANHNGPQPFLRQYNSPIQIYSNQAIVEALAAQSVHMKKPVLNSAELLETKKLTNIAQSPTYQLIHDEELRKGKIEEHGPPEEHVYNVLPQGGDKYRQEIHQSGCFKYLMHDLKGVSDF